jgi:cell wall assembly regulator SMI1
MDKSSIWLEMIAKHHAKNHPHDNMLLKIQPGATTQQIDDLSGALGITFPKEFRELYSACNGFGAMHEKQPEKTWWVFRPIEQIDQFTTNIRAWFSDTHRQYSDHFYPFIDFGNGDGAGYFMETNGKLMRGLICFKHEKYEFDKNQDVNEFLSNLPITIKQFLKKC